MDRADPNTPPAGDGRARDDRGVGDAEVEAARSELARWSQSVDRSRPAEEHYLVLRHDGQASDVISTHPRASIADEALYDESWRAALAAAAAIRSAAGTPDQMGEIERLTRERDAARYEADLSGEAIMLARKLCEDAGFPVKAFFDDQIAHVVHRATAAEAEAAALREESGRLRLGQQYLRTERDEALETLAAIHDFAHERSTGPVMPDALWEVRDMAAALRAETPPTPTVDHVDPINVDPHRQDPDAGRIVDTVRAEPGTIRRHLTSDQRRVLSALAAAPGGSYAGKIAVLLDPWISGRTRDLLIALRDAGLVHQIGLGSRWAITDEGRRTVERGKDRA